MKLSDKKELVRLLALYQQDLLKDNEYNVKEAEKCPDKPWLRNHKVGVKAQYEHARIISAKLSVEIGKELKTYWQL